MMNDLKKMFLALSVFLILACSGSDDGSVGEEPGSGTPPVEVEKPVAVDDTKTGKEDEELVITGLLDNDTVPQGSRITEVDSESDKGAEVVNNRNGSYTYFPEPDFTGEDSFTYTLCDQQTPPNCSVATVTVIIEDAGTPVAVDDAVNAVQNTTRILTDLQANDDTIDEASISSLGSAISGTVALNSDGSVSYTPEAGFTGTDTFTYTLCDDDVTPECSSATVTVTVLESVSFSIPAELTTYYGDLNFSVDADLNFVVLRDHTVAKHTTILTYFQRHEFLYDADEDLSNAANVILMYTSESRDEREYTSGSNTHTPQTFNTEHVYPQSRLSTEGAVTDLHHLRSCDDEINALRSNNPFTEGSGTYELINDDSWYPGDEWKGDVARMILYLNVRYGETFDKVGGLQLFLKWNLEDPVSDFELQRNSVIQTAQGVRNPFIDNPYLATLIWGGDPAENKWE